MAFAPIIQRPFSATFDRRAAVAAGVNYAVYCTFNDADATNLASYSWANVGDVRPGGNQWSATSFVCSSGRADASGNNRALLFCGASNGTLSATVRLANSASANVRGLIFRYTDLLNSWFAGLQYNANKWGIWQQVEGSLTERAVQAFTITPGADYVISVVLNENSIVATLNGGNAQSYSSATGVDKTTHGITGRYAGDLFENFALAV